jgi:hypothetical protein
MDTTTAASKPFISATVSTTNPTAGFPPAIYYVIVQCPSTNGQLDLILQTTGSYAGNVVNVKTGQPIFSFTVTGSL